MQEPLCFPDEILDEYDLKKNRKLSEVTFQLPPCRIRYFIFTHILIKGEFIELNIIIIYILSSKSAQEILKLVREILDEACTSSDECAVRLFYTSRNIFEMYAGLVPEHHKKFLETIPQQVGKNKI